MKVTREKALENAIQVIELVDMTSDWYDEAAESACVLRKMLAGMQKKKVKA
jgi:hypothetical protein